MACGVAGGGFRGRANAAVTFNAAQPYPAPWWVATGDVNGDGRLDVITASVSTNVISVLLGKRRRQGRPEPVRQRRGQ